MRIWPVRIRLGRLCRQELCKLGVCALQPIGTTQSARVVANRQLPASERVHTHSLAQRQLASDAQDDDAVRSQLQLQVQLSVCDGQQRGLHVRFQGKSTRVHQRTRRVRPHRRGPLECARVDRSREAQDQLGQLAVRHQLSSHVSILCGLLLSPPAHAQVRLLLAPRSRLVFSVSDRDRSVSHAQEQRQTLRFRANWW